MKHCEKLMKYFECECVENESKDHGDDCNVCFEIIQKNKKILIDVVGVEAYMRGKHQALSKSVYNE